MQRYHELAADLADGLPMSLRNSAIILQSGIELWLGQAKAMLRRRSR